jgi:hypothetical protein
MITDAMNDATQSLVETRRDRAWSLNIEDTQEEGRTLMGAAFPPEHRRMVGMSTY